MSRATFCDLSGVVARGQAMAWCFGGPFHGSQRSARPVGGGPIGDEVTGRYVLVGFRYADPASGAETIEPYWVHDQWLVSGQPMFDAHAWPLPHMSE